MMILKVLFAIVLAVVALTIFGKIRQNVAVAAPAKSAATAANPADPGLSPAGFFLLTRDEAANPRVVIMSPPDCPSEEAARARSLADSLAAAGIPTEMKQEIGGTFSNPDDFARFNKYMTNVSNPLVLVRGWAKGNPMAVDVIAQYHSGK